MHSYTLLLIIRILLKWVKNYWSTIFDRALLQSINDHTAIYCSLWILRHDKPPSNTEKVPLLRSLSHWLWKNGLDLWRYVVVSGTKSSVADPLNPDVSRCELEQATSFHCCSNPGAFGCGHKSPWYSNRFLATHPHMHHTILNPL